MDDEKAQLLARIGTEIRGKWTLERLLGEGGMAAVYVGVHRIGRREAIKILHSHVAADPELRLRFEQEARAVNRFQHVGAVEIRDIDVTDDGAPFLVMELLTGESLAERAKRGNLTLEELLPYVDQLLDVLSAAHAESIVHRDIKPDNLFVLPDGRIKVLDFGIARVRDGSSSRPATQAGMALGTVSYMPPEQLRGVGVDHRADLFATGATMLRLLTGRRVHEATTQSDLLVRMATIPAPPALTIAPDLPANVALVLDRALAFSKEQRYPDAATMQADVRALQRGERPAYAADRAATRDAPTAVGALALGTAKTEPDPAGSLAPASRVAAPPQNVSEPTNVYGAPPPSVVLAPPQNVSEPTNVYGPPPDVPRLAALAEPTSVAASASVLSTLPLPVPAVVRPLEAAITPGGAFLPTVASPSPVMPPVSAAASAVLPTELAMPSPVTPPDGGGTKPELVVGVVVALVGAAALGIIVLAAVILLLSRPAAAPPSTAPPSTAEGDPVGTGGEKKTSGTTTTAPPRTDPGPPGRDKDKEKKKK